MKFSSLLFMGLLCSTAIIAQSWDTTYKPLSAVIVSASKLSQKRTEAPISITQITSKEIIAARAQRIDYLLNKVAGVYMPSIGNEQHMMSIRQPISLKGLYLYVEDGLPIRTSGLFSSNALIEILSSNIHSIEVIKGAASALYGAEAIGGVINFLSAPLDSFKNVQLSAQASNLGLQKVDINSNLPTQKGGWQINASWTEQKKGPIAFSDYIKKGISIKHDFKWNKKWSGYQSLNFINYYSQMTGSVDSIHFFQKNFSSLQTFTFRKIDALRIRQNIQYQWSKNSSTQFNFMFRDNKMDQNPTYSIASTSNPTKFKGQTNSNKFNSYVIDLQHIWTIPQLQSKIIAGGYMDITKQQLVAHYIDIFKDTIIGKYTSFSYQLTDSLITNYHTKIINKALYLNYIAKLSNRISANATVRYDQFNYDFTNSLFTGTPSANNVFTHWTPKIGFTYNQPKWGGFINYSEGFVPPQITEIYNTIRVPYLLPQQFNNKEVGIWATNKKWQAEITLYQLNGSNEIISVRQTDGVNLNQNAGNTSHFGIEYQLKYNLLKNLIIGYNATNTLHTYVNTNIKGVDVSGKEMNAAPKYFGNIYAAWQANKNVNFHLEWLRQSKYFMDETNTTTYSGYDIGNLRIAYQMKQSNIWINILNITNAYYSSMATKNFSVKGNAAYSYYIGEPRSISIGYSWRLQALNN
jgi:outer membrane receptor protein involved in Fe transport